MASCIHDMAPADRARYELQQEVRKLELRIRRLAEQQVLEKHRDELTRAMADLKDMVYKNLEF